MAKMIEKGYLAKVAPKSPLLLFIIITHIAKTTIN